MLQEEVPRGTQDSPDLFHKRTCLSIGCLLFGKPKGFRYAKKSI